VGKNSRLGRTSTFRSGRCCMLALRGFNQTQSVNSCAASLCSRLKFWRFAVVDVLRITPLGGVAHLAHQGKIVPPIECMLDSRQTFTETGDSFLTLRILRPSSLGVCGEFSDFSFESLGWPSGRMRLDCRPNAVCQHPDFKRYRLDQSNQTHGRARPLNWISSRICWCCGTLMAGTSQRAGGSF
jgi:hypothetical protein